MALRYFLGRSYDATGYDASSFAYCRRKVDGKTITPQKPSENFDFTWMRKTSLAKINMIFRNMTRDM